MASPTMPWVWGTLTLRGRGDLGSVPPGLAARLLPRGDGASRRPGTTLRTTRLRGLPVAGPGDDGSWWQNTKRGRRPKYWTSLQLDEVALPGGAGLVARDGDDAADCEHVRRRPTSSWRRGRRPSRSAGRTRRAGPRTRSPPRSPGWCARRTSRAAQRRHARGHPLRGRGRRLADRRCRAGRPRATGRTRRQPYYLRVTKKADRTWAPPTTSATTARRRWTSASIVDKSFLGLVLFGRQAPGRPGDQELARGRGRGAALDQAPTGTMWHRFSRDGYGETSRGADWDIFDAKQRQTHRPRVAAAERRARRVRAAAGGRSALPYLRTIAGAANDGLLLPEQVWDGRPPRASQASSSARAPARPRRWPGRTRSSSAWPGRSTAGEPIERPSVVACRYTGAGC